MNTNRVFDFAFSLPVFLQRLRHCQGFGIQSPSDFAFVRDVVYQRMPYYAYADLLQSFTDSDKWSSFHKSILRLLFRLANYAQPSRYVISDSAPKVVEAYLRAGCTKGIAGRTLYYDVLPDEYCQSDCIIISDINGANRPLWDQLRAEKSARHLIAFDLYYLGIAFVNERRYPEYHIVNYY